MLAGIMLDQYPAQTTCEDCTGTTNSEVGYACRACPYPMIVNAARTSCAPCAAGTGPNSDRTGCLPCVATNYSTIGVCIHCVSPNIVNTDHTSCITPYNCPEGHECPEGIDCTTDSDCVQCLVGEVSNGRVRCVQCNELGKVANSLQAFCESCPPGTEPAANRSRCITCAKNNASSLGVICQLCPAGQIVNAARTICADIQSDGSDSITDPSVVSEVLKTTQNVLVNNCLADFATMLPLHGLLVPSARSKHCSKTCTLLAAAQGATRARYGPGGP